jgi:hypothetical protein
VSVGVRGPRTRIKDKGWTKAIWQARRKQGQRSKVKGQRSKVTKAQKKVEIDKATEPANYS